MTDNQHQIVDYKVDNSAIKAGRSSIGLRKRGERVQLKHMSPKEYRHYLYYTFNLNRFKGWNGIEKSDFAHNWQPDESQKIFMMLIKKMRQNLLKKLNKQSPNHLLLKI